MDTNQKVLAFLVDDIPILTKKTGASKGWITIGDDIFETNKTGCETHYYKSMQTIQKLPPGEFLMIHRWHSPF